MRNLIADVFNSAIKDIRTRPTQQNYKQQLTAFEFLASEWAETLAEFIDLDINAVREKLGI